MWLYLAPRRFVHASSGVVRYALGAGKNAVRCMEANMVSGARLLGTALSCIKYGHVYEQGVVLWATMQPSRLGHYNNIRIKDYFLSGLHAKKCSLSGT